MTKVSAGAAVGGARNAASSVLKENSTADKSSAGRGGAAPAGRRQPRQDTIFI